MKFILVKFFLFSMLMGSSSPVAVKSELQIHSKGMILEAQGVDLAHA